MTAFLVHIFMPDGDPEGVRVIEKANWSGEGLAFPRQLYQSKVTGREELTRPGVYVLWNSGEDGRLPRAYVGEGDVLKSRLDSHVSSKTFWTHGIAFTSKDGTLNKAHVQYLESQLVRIANDVGRCVLVNANAPRAPQLSPGVTAAVELYLADMLLCLPVLGVTFFEKPKEQAAGAQSLYLRGKGITAQGYESVSGFVVRSGSHATKEEAPAFHKYYPRLFSLRRELLANGILKEDGDAYLFVEDYLFTSPSYAAGVLLGHGSNGPETWRDASGRTLKVIRATTAEEE
ncbi:MAG: GIY-YIG nuclease family protein [Dehalococcoidia bacterium]|nr:GIY-YIG nuclease family protein [Dehalococcoidia bacterium]